jgi:hypothetical protein
MDYYLSLPFSCKSRNFLEIVLQILGTFHQGSFLLFLCVAINTLFTLRIHLRTQRNIALQTKAFALASLLAKKLLNRISSCCFLAM